MRYLYLKAGDAIQAGDEYHQFGRLWCIVDAKHVGHQKNDIFSHATTVRRPPLPAPSAEQLRQGEMF